MSAITIRFDGLSLLVALALGAAAYLLIGLIAGVTARARPASSARSRRIIWQAGLMSLATLAAFGLFFAWWAASSASGQGVNWLDWLILPWLALFILGCWTLTRR